MIHRRIKETSLLLMLFLMLIFGSAIQSSAATNVVTSAKTVSGGTWVKSGSNVKYRYANGTYAKGIWLKVDGKLYRINTSGYRQKGWFTVNKVKYYADSNGSVYVSKWLTKSGSKYYLQSNAAMAASKWVKIDGKYYYFASTGKMLKSKLIKSSGKYYYVNKNGARVTSTWVKIGGKKYYFDDKGVRAAKKWVKSGGKYYYLQANGTIATSKWVGNYYVDSTGARKTNTVKDGYYLDATGKKTVKVFKGKYIFVGDSRTVGMSSAMPLTDTEYVGKVSAGYSWLNGDGGLILSYFLKTNPNVTVIFAFGVNDYGNIASYLTYYRKVIAKYPSTKFYFMAVNPVKEKDAEAHNMHVKNSKIESFNAQLKAAFPKNYIDTYTMLKKGGFGTADGVHYDAATYKKIYEFVISKLS